MILNVSKPLGIGEVFVNVRISRQNELAHAVAHEDKPRVRPLFFQGPYSWRCQKDISELPELYDDNGLRLHDNPCLNAHDRLFPVT